MRPTPTAIEKTFRNTERALGVSLTFIDNGGIYHDRAGKALIGDVRQSHKKNPACAAGFSNRCIAHCRHEITARSRDADASYTHTCWKGLCEIVVPLKREGALVGSLFAGVWRAPNTPPTGIRLPRSFQQAFGVLGALSKKDASRIGDVVSWLSEGLLRDLDRALGVVRLSTNPRDVIGRFLAYRYHQDVRLADLADELHLSPSRASHLVTELCGRPFQTLLIEKRIAAARSLLRSSDLKVADVAREVGVTDAQYFARLFKQHTGLTPTEARGR